MTRRALPAVRPPTRTASAVVSLALHRLPAGPTRTRYERELIAELYGLTSGRQFRHALGVLLAAGAMNHAVGGRGPTILETTMNILRPAKPWGCRLNIRHRWEKQSTEDGNRFILCTRCNKEHPGTSKANYPMLGG